LFGPKSDRGATTSHQQITKDITIKDYQKWIGSDPLLKPRL